MPTLRHHAANLISVPYTMAKLAAMKIFYSKNIFFKGIERFSPNVVLNVDRKSRIEFGNHVSIHSRGRLAAVEGGQLLIRNHSSINVGCIIVCRKKVEIGCGVTIGPNVMIYDHDHIMDTTVGVTKSGFNADDVSIGDNTWIGAGTIILSNTKIGKNCVIAAGSVVKGFIPDNTVLIQRRENIYKDVE